MFVNVSFSPAISRGLVLFFLQLIISLSLTAQIQPYVTDGDVKAIARKNNTLYIGGNFNHVGPNIPFGISVNVTTGVPDMSFAAPNYIVETTVPDGAGGWYIGGYFTKVGNVTRYGIARIDASGAVTAFNANLNTSAYVRTIVVSGSRVYIGGGFTSAGGSTRTNFATLDATTGAVISGFAPSFSGGPVYAIAASGNNIYVGGYFRNVNGNTGYPYLVAIDATTGSLVTGFAPSPDRLVENLAVSGSNVYVGGAFSNIGGSAKSGFAAVDATTGTRITAFNPAANNGILDMELSSSTLYVAGFSGIYAVNATNGSVISSFTPAINGVVYDIQVSGSNIYVGGDFDTVAGLRRPYVAQLSSTGTVSAFNPKPQDIIRSVGIGNNNNVYLGGEFSTVGAAQRKNLAAIDATTGILIAGTNLDADSQVNALLLSGSTLYAGGEFTTIGGAAHNYLAAINTATNTVNAGFTASADDKVFALALADSTLYAGGNFTTMGGLTRPSLAAVNGRTGNVLPGFNAQVDDGATSFTFSSVRALAISGSTLYLGGIGIIGVGGSTRYNLASVNATTGALVTGFTANVASGNVAALAVSASTLYVGGNFQNINGSAGANIAALNMATGTPTAFSLSANDAVNTLLLSGSTLYVGGIFSTIGGTSQKGLAAVDATTGTLASTFRTDAQGVMSMQLTGNVLYAGGSFYNVNNNPRRGIVALNALNGVPLPVKLRSFTAVNAGVRNRIDWATAIETGNNTFEVEHSFNGSIFTTLGTLPGRGSHSEYSFYDDAPFNGTNYYRLKITDESGAKAYSSIAVVRNNSTGGRIAITPVPSTTEITIINTDETLNGKAAEVYSMEGRLMANFALQFRQTIDIRSWPSGIYILRLPEGGVMRLVKE